MWDAHQIERLFDSLMRDHPIGTLLFWKVDGNQKKNFQFYEFIRNYHEKNSKHNPFSRLNHVWIADITYIRLLAGFVYCAVVLDAFCCRALGYAISSSIDTALTLKALYMFVANRHPGAGVIHHSDQGVQYASREYADELESHGFQTSMSRNGNPYDNTVEWRAFSIS